MARSEKQKQKLFRLLEILMKFTDEERGLTMSEIIDKLLEFGIKAERKSLYDDFLVLEELGYPVSKISARPPQYRLDFRIFELAELKMLVDAVEASKFITAGKSREIISKLELFAGEHRSRELSRQVYVEDRVKSINPATIYSIDAVHEAINNKRKLEFKYFYYDSEKKKVYRNGGEKYLVSPCALLWNDENYYLVALDESADIIKNFRVDKMESLSVGDTIKDDERIKKFNPADYSRKIFGMYGGTEELVTLECKEKLASVMIDRFGQDIHFIKTDFGFKFTIRLMISPNFFAWILGFGEDIKILTPQPVRREFVLKMQEIAKNYEESGIL
jgi:predicted DNA-binding transcriptional regulator YafY